MRSLKKNLQVLLLSGISLFLCGSVFSEKENTNNKFKLDIRPFGELCYWSDQTGVLGKNIKESNEIKVPKISDSEWNIGVSWNEERDINKLVVEYKNNISESLLKETRVQYWFSTWPREITTEHKIEDHLDDPWQGEWLTAETDYQIKGNTITYTFKPITEKENSQATNLPAPVDYRRTLKLRLLYNSSPPAIRSFQVYTPTKKKKISLRIELGCDREINRLVDGKLEIFNGEIDKISGWKWSGADNKIGENGWKFQLNKQPKGIIADLVVAEPTLGGSTDLTVVTVRSNTGNFSFLPDDLAKGPIYIPVYSAYVTLASDHSAFVKDSILKGQTVREKLAVEPEQTYDRACREIPKLSVNIREQGGPLYLPLASDASWQKFGFEWGGNFYMNKSLSKVKGNELKRCNWEGAALKWSIGTGKEPLYVRDDKISHLSILDDYLPVPQVTWAHEGLLFKEEAFATLLEGPLSPYDAQRDEQTPAILMIKLEVSNPTNNKSTAHIWLKGNPFEKLLLDNQFIMDEKSGKAYIRASVQTPEGIELSSIEKVQDALHIPFLIPANQTKTFYFSFPFVGDLDEGSKTKFIVLNYEKEKKRVVTYWRNIADECIAYDVPEHKFNEMGRSTVNHIRMSATKDPKSGLFMVPAAAFKHPVYANEAAFQIVCLDKIGDHKTAESYLETFLQLQGRVPMPGTFTGDQSGVINGAKVDNDYNYSSSAYNMHHGTALWSLGEHFLLSHDIDWLKHAAPYMTKAADWIIDQRNTTKITDSNGVPVLHYGLLPAGHLEDNFDWGFWYAVNAYSYLGLKTTADAFLKANLPEADRLEKEAQNYLNDIRNSIKKTSELSPVVRLRNNTYVPFFPSRVYQRFRYFGPMQSGFYSRHTDNYQITYRLSATREALYGPIILIKTGIIDPFDPLAEAILDDWEDNITLTSSLGQSVHGVVDDEYWFSRGGMVFQANLQNPIQAYIMRNEIPAAIRNIYNSMVSCLYRDVNLFTEEYRRWGVGSGRLYKVPDEARFVNRVCDMLAVESNDELWLASGTPRYWLEPGKAIKLYKAATTYGNVSFELHKGEKPNSINGVVNLPLGIPEGKVKLFVRLPQDSHIMHVSVNGKEWTNWNREKEYIVLPVQEREINLTVSY
jgi:hypothetical protein